MIIKEKRKTKNPKTALKAVADGEVNLVWPVRIIADAVRGKGHVHADGADGR
jgi:hypothetical protein